MIDIPILFEDDAICVINKPPGLVVNRAVSVKEETVQDWVEKNYELRMRNDELDNKDIVQEFLDRSGVVHRIDKETSGILLIAKTAESFFNLKEQFQNHLIKKTYLAIVHGVPSSKGTITAPVDRLPWNPKHFGIVAGGKESVTKYKRITNYELRITNGITEKISLCEVYPETGRTHQIRVHFKYIGHPLLGDYLYAGRKTSRDDRTIVPRIMLHAWKLTCTHPATGKPLAFEAPIPDDMKRMMNGNAVNL